MDTVRAQCADCEDCLVEVLGLIARAEALPDDHRDRAATLMELSLAAAELEFLVDEVDPGSPVCGDAGAVIDRARALCASAAAREPSQTRSMAA